MILYTGRCLPSSTKKQEDKFPLPSQLDGAQLIYCLGQLARDLQCGTLRQTLRSYNNLVTLLTVCSKISLKVSLPLAERLISFRNVHRISSIPPSFQLDQIRPNGRDKKVVRRLSYEKNRLLSAVSPRLVSYGCCCTVSRWLRGSVSIDRPSFFVLSLIISFFSFYFLSECLKYDKMHLFRKIISGRRQTLGFPSSGRSPCA